MTGQGDDPGERSDDDIDARFEEIIAGLRAEVRAEQEDATERREAARRRAAEARRQRALREREQLYRDGIPPETPHDSRTNPPLRPRRSDRPSLNPPPAEFQQPSGAPPPTDPSDRDTGAPDTEIPGAGTPDSETPDTGTSDTGTPPETPDHDTDTPPEHPEYPERHTDAPGPEESGPGPAWRGWEESDEEEHFIPPTPPLPAGDLHLWSIVIGLLGGPLVLILSEVFGVLRSDWWTIIGILMAVTGVVLMFLRLPKNRDYHDPSGGAHV